MKINRVPPSKTINQYIHVKDNIGNSSSVSQGSDRVELTKESLTFSAALKEVRKSLEARTPAEVKHIEEVARLIKDGDYNVSGEDVAAKILGIEE